MAGGDLVFITTDDGLPLVVRADGTLRLPTAAEAAARRERRERESGEIMGRRDSRTRKQLTKLWLEESLAAREGRSSEAVEDGGLAVEPFVAGGGSEDVLPVGGDLMVVVADGDGEDGPERGDLRFEGFHAFLQRTGVIGHGGAPDHESEDQAASPSARPAGGAS